MAENNIIPPLYILSHPEEIEGKTYWLSTFLPAATNLIKPKRED